MKSLYRHKRSGDYTVKVEESKAKQKSKQEKNE